MTLPCRFALLALLALAVTGLNGCGLAIKTAVDTARGGTSRLLVVEPVADLRAYDSLYLVPFTSAIGRQMEPQTLAHLNRSLDSSLAGYRAAPAQGRPLQVSGTVLHLEDHAMEELIVVQVRLVDAASARPLGLVNVTGESNRIRGITASLDAVAAGVSELLAAHRFASR